MNHIHFSEYQTAFDREGLKYSPSEIHGLLTALLCRNPKAIKVELDSSYRDWFGTEPGQEVSEKLNLLFEATSNELDEYGEFQFRILMPEDDVHIDVRSKALGSFCAGFLSGFGNAPMSDDIAPDDIAEALHDFERIATLRDTVEDSNENEADLLEIVEYVRVSVLLIFAQCRGQ